MNNDELINSLRWFHFAAGILLNQQNDPFCSKCSAFAKTAEDVIGRFSGFKNIYEAEKGNLPDEFVMLFQSADEKLKAIKIPAAPEGQKKAGNCRLSKGVCFTKEVIAFLERMKAESGNV
jgi:hypothetical protein